MNNDNDNTLLESSHEALDESIEHLDAQTLSRLNQARQQALSQKKDRSRTGAIWIPAGSLATFSVVVFVGLIFLSSPDPVLNNLDEAEFMASNEEMALIEDLEFITWLIEEENAS